MIPSLETVPGGTTFTWRPVAAVAGLGLASAGIVAMPASPVPAASAMAQAILFMDTLPLYVVGLPTDVLSQLYLFSTQRVAVCVRTDTVKRAFRTPKCLCGLGSPVHPWPGIFYGSRPFSVTVVNS